MTKYVTLQALPYLAAGSVLKYDERIGQYVGQDSDGMARAFFGPQVIADHPTLFEEVKEFEHPNGLTVAQAEHRNYITNQAHKRIRAKYAAGALEHQTNLKDDTTTSQLLEFAIDEAIDQIVYLLTLKQKIVEENTACA
jgi:hypothetical protein